MYKIIGADGKEYGPVSIEQLRLWLQQGRISGQTKIQVVGQNDWAPATQVPELAGLFSPPNLPSAKPGAPPVLSPLKPSARRQGLAVASFVLGLCSFVLCLSFLTGIPAIICGHIARSRAKKLPEHFSGAGMAMAGIVLGYVSIIFSLVIAGLVIPAVSQAKRQAQWQGNGWQRNQRQRQGRPSNCENNLRQIGLAFKVWALDHNDQFPFNVSTNSGGTLELCNPGPDGNDQNAAVHFRAISTDLNSASFLVCPKDHEHHAASGFDNLEAANVSYQLRTGTNVNSDNPQQVLAVCPIDGNTLYCDGNVRKGKGP